MSKIYDQLGELLLNLNNCQMSEHVCSMVDNVIKFGCNNWIWKNTETFKLPSNDNEKIEECNGNSSITDLNCIRHLSISSEMKPSIVYDIKEKDFFNTMDDDMVI